MRAPQDVIIKPIITEKAMDGVADKKYVFQVAVDSNKIEIKKAVASLFNIKENQIAKVTTVNVTGKMKRMGRNEGKRADTKKAYVLLKESAKPIEFFEGMV